MIIIIQRFFNKVAFFILLLLIGCTKNNKLPILTTLEVTNITSISALSGGEIASDGGNSIISRGVVWSINPSRAVTLETKTIDGTGVGTFNSKITGLKEKTTYYIRAYATTNSGTSYGNEISFKTNNINIENGLVAYYPLDDNDGADYSGNQNHGNVNGPILTADRFGNPNKAYEFDGINDYIIVANSQTLNPSSISISGWFNSNTLPTDPNGGANSIISKWYQQLNCSNNSDNYTVQLTNINGKNLFAAATSKNPLISNLISTEFSSQMQNKWVHFTFIHDALIGQKVYINGALVSSNAVKGGLCTTTNPLYIGADARLNLPLWRFMKGKLDELRIYNRVLNAEEISYLSVN